MFLYHYFSKSIGPFRNLSDLPINNAKNILKQFQKNNPSSQPASRPIDYIDRRINFENILKNKFIEIGGKPERNYPQYMIVEHYEWFMTWYEDTCFIKIPVEEFEIDTISFTYGDSHPTFDPGVNDGKEYRKKLYKYNEIIKIIEKYDLPQKWNPDWKLGPETYVEVQIWSDKVINKYRKIYNKNNNVRHNCT